MYKYNLQIVPSTLSPSVEHELKRSPNPHRVSPEFVTVHRGTTDEGKDPSGALVSTRGARWIQRSSSQPLILLGNQIRPESPECVFSGFKRGGRSESRGAGPPRSWPSETRPAGGTATRPPAPVGRWSAAGSFGPG